MSTLDKQLTAMVEEANDLREELQKFRTEAKRKIDVLLKRGMKLQAEVDELEEEVAGDEELQEEYPTSFADVFSDLDVIPSAVTDDELNGMAEFLFESTEQLRPLPVGKTVRDILKKAQEE